MPGAVFLPNGIRTTRAAGGQTEGRHDRPWLRSVPARRVNVFDAVPITFHGISVASTLRYKCDRLMINYVQFAKMNIDKQNEIQIPRDYDHLIDF